MKLFFLSMSSCLLLLQVFMGIFPRTALKDWGVRITRQIYGDS